MKSLFAPLLLLPTILGVRALPAPSLLNTFRNVSKALFDSLEELARIVDITYCVGSSGIQKPFTCLSRCQEFEGFELITTWNTGPLLSDSCGYIALSHPPQPKRIIVAFRGTYSIANTVTDLSTYPAEYLPFPGDNGSDDLCTADRVVHAHTGVPPQVLNHQRKGSNGSGPKCENCTVHAGFMASWRNTRCTIIPDVENALAKYPDYQVTLVGHSLGGAVAALASLEFKARGWEPQVTTFGEPRVGNKALSDFINSHFNLNDQDVTHNTFRRVTHVNDPIPLLPLEEWGYRMHAGEIFISKASLSPAPSDLHHCRGNDDPRCVAGETSSCLTNMENATLDEQSTAEIHGQGMWRVSPRFKLWQLFFAHRDYFWRLGLCVPGGDPTDWWRERYPEDELSFH